MKAKLVREGLRETHPNKEVEAFFSKYHDKILDEWVNKLKRVFKDYLPFDASYDSEEDPDEILADASNEWWMKIVEPGWESLTTKLFIQRHKIADNSFIDKEDEIIDEALKILGLPRQIIE